MICRRAREKKYVKDEKDNVQITVDVTLVNDDDKQTHAQKRDDFIELKS